MPAAGSKRKGQVSVKVISARIRTRREQVGMSQVELAFKVGVDPSTIWRIEKGSAAPKVDTLQKVARALGMPVGWPLVEEVDEGAVA